MKPMWVDFLYDLENTPDKEYVVKGFSENLNDNLEDIEYAIRGMDLNKALKMLQELRRCL